MNSCQGLQIGLENLRKGFSVLTIVMTRVIDIIYCSHPFDFDHAFHVAKLRILPLNENKIWRK